MGGIGRNGSIFAMLFGGVALVGVLGVSTMNLVVGPVSTAAKVTHQNHAQNDLLMNAKIVVMNASTRPNQGDEDGDGYVEPVPFIPTSASSCNITLPAGSSGGCLPGDIGAILTDPWGTQYMYCVWDHGDPATSTNRITGEDSTSGAVLAIISAGPNKRFETPCRAYDGDPATNDDAINPDGLGDDLVQIYTYAAAVAGSGGLWELKQNEPETAIINKKLEIGDMATGMGFAFDTETGQGEFPYVKTDFIASKTGGNTPVTMVNNIALDGNWLSGSGNNRGIFVAANGNVGIGTDTPLAPLSYYGNPSRNHSDPIASLADYDLVLGCKLQQGNCSTATAVGISASGYTNANNQPAIALEYRARGHAFHNGSEQNPLLRIDPALSYQDSTVVIRAHSPNAEKGILGLESSNGTNVLTALSNGRVGVGIPNPQATLHVGGVVRTDSRFVSWPTTGNAQNRAMFLGVMSDTTATANNWDAGDIVLGLDGGANSGANTLRVVGEGSRRLNLDVFNGDVRVRVGKIGVGLTGAPRSSLDVVGGIRAAQGMPTNNDSNVGYSFGIDGDTGMFAPGSGATGNGLSFALNSNEYMRITSAGRVGIGTTAPTQMLQVNGIVDVTNNRILRVATPTATTDAANKSYVDLLGNRTSCANGQVLKWNGTTWACAGDNIGMPDNFGDHTASQNINLNGKWLSGDGDNEGIFIDTSGNVQIGDQWLATTDTEGPILSFSGANNTDRIFLSRYNEAPDISHLRITIGDNPTGAVMDALVVGPTAGNTGPFKEVFRVQANGRVGIGTTSPISGIHVKGTGGDDDDLRFESYSNTASHGGAIHSIRARGTDAVPVAVQNNDRLFWLQGFGHNGTTHQAAASIIMSAANDFSTSVDGQILLYTHNAGTSGLRMAIRPNGDVGIGIAVPRERLHVNGNVIINGDRRIYFNHDGDTNANNDYIQYFDDNSQMFSGNAGWIALYAKRDRGVQTWDTPSVSLSARGAYFERRVAIGTKAPRADLHSANGALLGSLQIGTVAENSQVDMPWAYESISTTSTSQNLRLISGANMYFHTAMTASEPQDSSKVRFAIAATGNVGVGVVNPSHLLHVNGVARSTQATFATSSDNRVKTNVQNIENGLDVIGRLRPVTYEYTKDYQGKNGDLGGVRRGFIAQEVEAIIPDAVSRTEEQVGDKTIEDFRVLNNDDFVPLLVRAVQELKNENDVLRTEIKEIKSMQKQ